MGYLCCRKDTDFEVKGECQKYQETDECLQHYSWLNI